MNALIVDKRIPNAQNWFEVVTKDEATSKQPIMAAKRGFYTLFLSYPSTLDEATKAWVLDLKSNLLSRLEATVVPLPSIHVEAEENLEEKFHRLASEWKEETGHLSSMPAKLMHPKYQAIIGMGPDVLPILFRELQRKPDHWFWALSALTEQNPIPDEAAGNLKKMTQAWLNWAREHDYL
jgi:hypothetical protein